MGLYDTPFRSIESGRKTVEVRLYDEKRKKIKLGDLIKFTKLPDKNETLIVKVLGLQPYSSFKEMYKDIPSSKFDCEGKPIDEMIESTYTIYSPDQEKKWGTLAMMIKLIKS